MSKPSDHIITRLLIARAGQATMSHHPVVSIGVVVDDRFVFWGDCRLEPSEADPLPTIQRLIDLTEKALSAQTAPGFRELCELIDQVFPPVGRLPLADSIRGAIQLGLLRSISHARKVPVIEVLASEYALPGVGGKIDIPIFLEVNDFAASAELIDRLLVSRPNGIAYRLTSDRVAESIGENAEYLQSFVRELGRRGDVLAGEGSYRPAIYLGVNGAFGKLAGDSVRHIGKILSLCIDLQEAAGSRSLIIEEPFMLDSTQNQSIQMRRLKDLLVRSPSSQNRTEPTLLVQRTNAIPESDLIHYIDNQAVDGFVIEPLVIGNIAGAMNQLKGLNGSGLHSFIRCTPANGSSSSYRWMSLAADMAVLSRSSGMLINFDNGDENIYQSMVARLAETAAWLRYKE